MELTIQEQFAKVDTSDLPQFDDCHIILEQVLWVLWVAKDKLGIRKLLSEQIASILRNVKEVSITPTGITQSLKRAGNRIHSYREDGGIFYEIMKAGKDYLRSLKSEGTLELFYFEPNQKYSSKRLLVNDIFGNLGGDLKIVDPYCGERTLDVLKDIKNKPISFLTKLDNITNINAQNKLVRELKDFKAENPDIEFRDYSNTDLHDRYIISTESLVLLGYSIKDLGARESFAIVLNKEGNKNIYQALSENFDRRWKRSSTI